MLGLDLALPVAASAAGGHGPAPMVISAKGANATVTFNGNGSYNIVCVILARVTALSSAVAGNIVATYDLVNLGVNPEAQVFGLSTDPAGANVGDGSGINFGFQVYHDGECYIWTGATGNNGFTNRISPNLTVADTMEVRRVGTAIKYYRNGAEVAVGLGHTSAVPLGFLSYAGQANMEINGTILA